MTMVSMKTTKLSKNGYIVIESSPSKSLLFVYQSSWMKPLLKTYGSEVYLLDATYKTKPYALPLFFFLVTFFFFLKLFTIEKPIL